VTFESSYFEQKGESVEAYASFNNTAEGSIPNWKCFVDGNVIASIGSPDNPNNNWEICNSAGTDLGRGMHNFTLEVTGVGNNTMFWLDWIAYRPPEGYIVVEGTVYFPPDTLNIAYSGSWEQWSPYNLIGAAEKGASAVVSYWGTLCLRLSEI
jgi:hypothetical protein